MKDTIGLIKKYRSVLMGVMMLWIVLFHSNVALTFWGIPEFLVRVGYGGVDGFLFLSGFGLYYSLQKDPDVGRFYKRRAEKMLPAYVPVILVWALYLGRHTEPLEWLRLLIGNLTGTALWAGLSCYNWYILLLFLLYLLAPILKDQMDAGGKRRTVWLLAALICMSMTFFGSFSLMAATRFPVFVMGMYLAKMDCAGEKPKEWLWYVWTVIGTAALYYFWRKLPDLLWSRGLWWYPFILITPGLLAALSRLSAWLDRSKAGAWLVGVFRRMGEASLEICLIHVPVFQYLESHYEMHFRWRVLAIFASILASFLYRWIIGTCKKRVHRIKAKTN